MCQYKYFFSFKCTLPPCLRDQFDFHLSLTVFSPPGTYFNCIMFMVASSVVTTIMILNYHHRKADTHNMPAWVRIIFLQWIPWFLRMSRPGEKITLKTLTIQSKMKELDPPSKSLLANVLDMEDDYRPTVPPPPLPPSNHHNHLSPPLSNHINHNHAHKNGGLFRYDDMTWQT